VKEALFTPTEKQTQFLSHLPLDEWETVGRSCSLMHAGNRRWGLWFVCNGSFET